MGLTTVLPKSLLSTKDTSTMPTSPTVKADNGVNVTSKTSSAAATQPETIAAQASTTDVKDHQTDHSFTKPIHFSPHLHFGHRHDNQNGDKTTNDGGKAKIGAMLSAVTPSTSTFSNGTNERPNLSRTPSVQTRYMDMLLSLDTIPRLHNIAASFFTWILLAGYVIFPGTFTTLQKSTKVQNAAKDDEGARILLRSIRNAPLLWVAGACCIIGAGGMILLWYRWRKNYVWIINKVFL
jgi:hypothetical protein